MTEQNHLPEPTGIQPSKSAAAMRLDRRLKIAAQNRVRARRYLARKRAKARALQENPQ